MSLLTLLKTNMIISNRESVNAFVSYIAYGVLSLLVTVPILVLLRTNKESEQVRGIITFVSFLFFCDYIFAQIKLRSASLIDKSSFSLFPVSRSRSLLLRLFLFLVDKRILFYLLPMGCMMVLFANREETSEAFTVPLLFIPMYMVMSEVSFFFYSILRKLANRFSARVVTQIAMLPFIAIGLLVNVVHHKVALIAMVPIMSQCVKGFHAILASRIEAASIEGGYLLVISFLFALAAPNIGFVSDKFPSRKRLQLVTHGDKRCEDNPDSLNIELSLERAPAKKIEENAYIAVENSIAEISKPVDHTSWQLILMDWLIHQREEKILYLLLLWPLTMIFLIIKMIPNMHYIHFEPGLLILPVFFLTQFLGVYFTENHFTSHGLRLTHFVLTPLDPYRFVFSKSISTWGLLSLMNVFVCMFCGVYLNMNFYTLAQGTVYSIFLPLVLLQSANTLGLYFPGISRHPLISLIMILVSELVITAIYVFMMLLNFLTGILLVAAIFILSYVVSLPVWGRQLSKQIQILLEFVK